jgi:hypothetical protein
MMAAAASMNALLVVSDAGGLFTYAVELQFPANITNTAGSDKEDLVTILHKEVRYTLPNVTPDLNSLFLVSDQACPPSQVVMANSCVECSYGAFFDKSQQSCVECPAGT